MNGRLFSTPHKEHGATHIIDPILNKLRTCYLISIASSARNWLVLAEVQVSFQSDRKLYRLMVVANNVRINRSVSRLMYSASSHITATQFLCPAIFSSPTAAFYTVDWYHLCLHTKYKVI